MWRFGGATELGRSAAEDGRMTRFLALSLVALCFGTASRAHAQLGKQETLNYLQPIDNKAVPEKFMSDRDKYIAGSTPRYTLGYKTSMYLLLLPFGFTDDGYVLIDNHKSRTYIPLDGELRRELQQAGAIPTPLPPYSCSVWSYAAGYSGWGVVGLVSFAFVFRSAIRVRAAKRRRAKIRQLGGVCPHCASALSLYQQESGFCGSCSRSILTEPAPEASGIPTPAPSKKAEASPDSGDPFAGFSEAYMADLGPRVDAEAARADAEMAAVIGAAGSMAGTVAGVDLPGPDDLPRRRRKKARRVFGLETELSPGKVLLVIGIALLAVGLLVYLLMRR